MNNERRLAVLEAFACTKPREFDAFLQAWSEANPEPQPEPILIAAVEEPKPASRRRKAPIEPTESSADNSSDTES